MNPFYRSKCACQFVLLISLIAPTAIGQDMLDVLPLDRSPTVDLKVPVRPHDFVLDSALFLGEETRKELARLFGGAAQHSGVSVYLLTLPKLPKGALAPFTKQVAAEWTKDEFGAVIVFDDETGVVAIEKSNEVSKRFYEFELVALLKDSMKPQKRPRLSREGLVHTSKATVNALEKLKARADQEDRRSFITRIAVVCSILTATAVAFLFHAGRKRRDVEQTPATD